MAFKTRLSQFKMIGQREKVIVTLTGITVCTLVNSSDSATNELPYTITWLIHTYTHAHTHTHIHIYFHTRNVVSSVYSTADILINNLTGNSKDNYTK